MSRSQIDIFNIANNVADETLNNIYQYVNLIDWKQSLPKTRFLWICPTVVVWFYIARMGINSR